LPRKTQKLFADAIRRSKNRSSNRAERKRGGINMELIDDERKKVEMKKGVVKNSAPVCRIP
jgi:hypothetical protein